MNYSRLPLTIYHLPLTTYHLPPGSTLLYRRSSSNILCLSVIVFRSLITDVRAGVTRLCHQRSVASPRGPGVGGVSPLLIMFTNLERKREMPIAISKWQSGLEIQWEVGSSIVVISPGVTNFSDLTCLSENWNIPPPLMPWLLGSDCPSAPVTQGQTPGGGDIIQFLLTIIMMHTPHLPHCPNHPLPYNDTHPASFEVGSQSCICICEI